MQKSVDCTPPSPTCYYDTIICSKQLLCIIKKIPLKDVIKKRSIFFDEGVNVFILKNCWNRFCVRHLLSAKPLVKSC